MPSSRAPKVSGEGPLLKTWRQEGPSGRRAKLWLVVRRATATLAALALVGWLGYLVFSPMLLPKTYFAYLAADDQRVLAAPPIEFPYEDFAGCARLQGALTPLTLDSPGRLLYATIVEPDSLDKEIDGLRDSSIGDNDVLILWITAHGVVWNGKAYLTCGNFEPVANGENLYELSKLLRRIGDLPGATKLLVLDAGRSDYAPRLGMVANAFADELKQVVETLESPQVWVLSAHSPGERSHVSPALQRSVFGYMTATGLQGAADLDSDRAVDLHELYQFVRFNVAEWVKQATDDRETQTPALLGKDIAQVSTEPHHLLYTAGLPEIKAIGTEMNAARTGESRSSLLAAVARFMSQRVAEFGVDVATTTADSAEQLLTAEGDTGDSDDGGGDKPPDQSERETARRAGELELINEAWRLTAEVDDSIHPTAYAPHLWRLHLDRLMWLESLQQSGERTDRKSEWLVNELRSVNRSLEALGKPEKPLPEKPQNVIDRIRLRRPKVPLEVGDAPTLALAEAIADADLEKSLPPKLGEFVEAYDTWIATADGLDRLDALVDESWNDAWRQFYELQLLDDLRADLDLPLDLVKLALDVRRLGEHVAADLLWGQGWAAEETAKADRLRLEAERLLRDKAASDWKVRARSNLQDARLYYQNAQQQLQTVRSAIRWHQQLLSRARDYLRWRRHSPDDSTSKAPSAKELTDLFESLKKLQDLLDSPNRARLPNVNLLERDGTEFQDRLSFSVENLASKGGVAWRMESLLRTALLAPDDRAKCLADQPAAEGELMGDFRTSPSKAVAARLRSRQAVQRVAEHLWLELQFVDTFRPKSDDLPIPSINLDTIERAELLKQSDALRKLLSELPGDIREVASANSNLTDVDRRPARLRRLRQASRALHLVDSFDSIDDDADRFRSGDSDDVRNSLQEVLYDAEWYDLLRAARERRKRAWADAPIRELAELKQQVDGFGDLAARIPGQPELEGSEPSRMSLQITQSDLELVTKKESILNLNVRSGDDTPVWIVASYDENLLEVEGLDDTILQERDVRRAPALKPQSVEAAYPYRPDARRGMPRTFLLPAGSPRTLDVRVVRRSSAEGNATLVFKAVSRSEYIRRQIPVRLPGAQELELSIFDGISTQRISDDGVRVFPNRVQDLTLQVANKGGKAKSLTAHLYAPQRAMSAVVPTGAIQSVAAETLLRRFGRRVRVATGARFELPPGGVPVPLTFDFDSPENSSLLGARSNEGPTRISLPYGLLLDLVDQVTGEHTIRQIHIEVWRPLTYLDARATYDPGAQELTVTVDAPDAARLPPDVVRAELVVDKNYVSARGGGVFAAAIKEPSYRAILKAPLNGSWPRDFDALAEDYLPAYVHIDAYPRAFEFRVRNATAQTDLMPVTDITEIQVVVDASEFKASPSVQAHVQIDVPDGYFDQPESLVEIGVDIDQDRELRDEESVVLRSDRHVEVYALAPVSEGTFALAPRVGDFELDLPTEGIPNKRVNILGQIQIAGGVSKKDYVEIALDGRGPVIDSVKLLDTGSALIVEVHPTDLTGVKTVEAAFESATEVKWNQGKWEGGSQWTVEMSTAKVLAGQHTILIRATDQVGNVSEILRETWNKKQTTPLVRASNAATATGNGEDPAPAPVKNRVQGIVTYGRGSVSDVKVELSGPGAPQNPARNRDGGKFDFGLVPAGTYTLDARGLAGGNYHSAQMSITVSDQPETPLNLEVKIR